MFGSRLKLDITRVGAAVSKFLWSFARVMENQNLSGRIAEDDWDPTFLAFVGLDLVKHLPLLSVSKHKTLQSSTDSKKVLRLKKNNFTKKYFTLRTLLTK